MDTREKLKQELLALQDKRGRLRPRDVWQWARRNKSSELAKKFQWNEKSAAEAHWDDVARDLIRTYLTVQVVTSRKVITTVGYVRDPRADSNEQSMVSVTSKVDLDRRDAEQIMLAELGRCRSAIERARGVAAVLDQRYPGTTAKLENLLLGLVDLSDTFAEAAE